MKWFLILHNLQHRRMNHGQPWDFAFPFLLKLKRCARNRYNLVILSLFSEIFGHFYVQKHLEPHHKILVFLAFRIMQLCFESQVSLFNSLIMQSVFFLVSHPTGKHLFNFDTKEFENMEHWSIWTSFQQKCNFLSSWNSKSFGSVSCYNFWMIKFFPFQQPFRKPKPAFLSYLSILIIPRFTGSTNSAKPYSVLL